jgi:hypothetical protein
MCEFTSANDAVLDEDSILRALDPTIKPLKFPPFEPRNKKKD